MFVRDLREETAEDSRDTRELTQLEFSVSAGEKTRVSRASTYEKSDVNVPTVSYAKGKQAAGCDQSHNAIFTALTKRLSAQKAKATTSKKVQHGRKASASKPNTNPGSQGRGVRRSLPDSSTPSPVASVAEPVFVPQFPPVSSLFPPIPADIPPEVGGDYSIFCLSGRR